MVRMCWKNDGLAEEIGWRAGVVDGVGAGERVGGGVASCGTGVCSGTKSDDGSSVGSTFRFSTGSCMPNSGSSWSAMSLAVLCCVVV